jgi:hypothetical protein
MHAIALANRLVPTSQSYANTVIVSAPLHTRLRLLYMQQT